ncbi:acid-sensing ion channel 3-like [Gigantopelta aegis]|uniref:acid-sensing ion channel 3-like n=1 Tax=Gigantopelta aegis TaxID=1735272 RepID=UPI001B888EA7|nr:acid-sensing ion channel 3-like [Gigantopelta aegis]
MGVCYQFNPNPDDVAVDKANKDGGLDLMLFVEQYDYMRGPQTSVGVLVVITDHNETQAIAKEQGIGLTVGQSVSVGLQKSDVIDLPPPHGECGTATLDNYPPDVTYTYQRCHLNCLTSFIKRKCGCVTIYMPGNMFVFEFHYPYCEQ